MSESVKAAQTLVWRATGGDGDKTHPICDSTGRRKSALLGGERRLSLQRFPRVQRWTIYIESLIALARYKR